MCTGVGDGAVNLKVNCCPLSVVEESPLVLSLSDAKPSEAEGFALPAASQSVAALPVETEGTGSFVSLELGLKKQGESPLTRSHPFQKRR